MLLFRLGGGGGGGGDGGSDQISLNIYNLVENLEEEKSESN